jgi:phenolic acid decarboxylase
MAETSTQKPAEQPNAVEQYLKDKRWIEEPEVLPWYVKDLVDLEPKTRELFETYSRVPSDDVVSHIKSIRDKTFKIVRVHSKTGEVRINAILRFRIHVLVTGGSST